MYKTVDLVKESETRKGKETEGRRMHCVFMTSNLAPE